MGRGFLWMLGGGGSVWCLEVAVGRGSVGLRVSSMDTGWRGRALLLFEGKGWREGARGDLDCDRSCGSRGTGGGY